MLLIKNATMAFFFNGVNLNMQEIKRDLYLNRLQGMRENGLAKVITGIRRCGKSYLLDPIYKNYLIKDGVREDHIIKIELDKVSSHKFYKDPEGFDNYIRSFIKDNKMYYLIIDEIQLVKNFEFVINGLLYDRNIDVYVTGSNSKFLSSDIITEFRGRGDRLHVNPLSYLEFQSGFSGGKKKCFDEYLRYGGMPLVLSKKEETQKSDYLKELFKYTYFKDIVERSKIKRVDILETLMDILSSNIGSLTNPQKILNTFKTAGQNFLSSNTINSYLDSLENSFIVRKAVRYDVKGRKYIGALQKYYFSDLGLRNARLNFRQQEESHLMENLIYNELMLRGYNVDVGVVEIRNRGKRIQTEIDFVCNMGDDRYYIQSTLDISGQQKLDQEQNSLNHINDNFKKIIITKGHVKPWRTERGYLVIGLLNFLEDYNYLKKIN